MRKYFLFAFLFSATIINAQTKQDTSKASIETKSGGVFTGQVIETGGSTVNVAWHVVVRGAQELV